ncbi:LIM domain-containing protein WLIM2b-like [Canna indica]|uniref:LIM domain-containing protein WLIM2b-like n=1 Tax=Canna indica TaxID=4628 RepID=A0AAQ3Q7L1_9LILI|nr:LIM domain-containing protein WLIM2b-like [Canna indica]
MEGTLYCKPHFEQLFKETGSFTKKFPGAKSGGAESAKDVKSPSKFSAMFSGTQDKCASCHKIAYPLEKLTVEEKSYHKNCFRCYSGGCKLTTSSYAALDGVLYCKHHFAQLFKEKGSYTQLNKVASMRRSLSAGSEAAINKAAEEAVAEVPEAEAEPKKKDDAEES